MLHFNSITRSENGAVSASRRLLFTIAIGLSSVAGLLAQPRYAVTDLGALPGAASSVASGLNDRGDVVGYCAPAADNFNQTAFVWQSGGMRSLGKLPKGNYSLATAINSSGVIVGDGDTGNIRPQSWVTGPRGLINFFPNNGGNTHAIGINDSGAICGYYTKSLSGNTASWRGAIWTVDPKDPRKFRKTDLPILGGVDPSVATALPFAFNQSGQAAGYAVNDLIGQHAAFWNSDASHSIVDLGTYPGDWSSLAWGMNDLGQVVGSSHPPFRSRAVLWDDDAAHTPIELPLLPGDIDGAASAINNAGEILGSSTSASGVTRLVIWKDGQSFDLQPTLDNGTGAGWELQQVSAINNLGQIAATGRRNGLVRAMLLTPLAP